MVEFAVLTGHLTPRCRSGAVAGFVGQRLRAVGAEVTDIEVGALPHSALMAHDRRHPEVLRTQRALLAADAAVIVLPRYEPHGSAPLRSWLAMAPHGVFAARPVLPIGLGAVRSQSIGIGTGLLDGAVLPATFLYDDWFDAHDGWRPGRRAADLLRHAVAMLADATVGRSAAA